MKKKLSKVKGVGGFTITWLMLTSFSLALLIFDWKVGIVGFLTAVALGYLGFDIVIISIMGRGNK